MVITASTLNPTDYFTLDGLEYEKDLYTIAYANIMVDNTKSIVKSQVHVGLREKYNFSKTLKTPVPVSYWNDGTTDFNDLDTLITYLSGIISFNNGGGLGSGFAITQKVANFAAFTSGDTVGELGYAEASQGTQWLPTTLGGTYYPSGFYVWDGTNWVSDRNAITNQLEENLLGDAAITKDMEVIVKVVGDFPSTLSSTVVYFLDGIIDLGTRELVVPEGGLVIAGHDYFVSGLISTENNHTMFIDGAAAYAGNLKLSNLFITSSGTSSKIFELDNEENSGAVELGSVNLGDFSDTTTSLGELSNYRQFRTNDCGLFRIQDGLSFAGTWSGGFRVNDTIVLSQAASSTLFKVGAGLTFAARCISDINAASVDPTTITFDFVDSNFLLDGGFQLTGASFAPNSSISVTTDETSVKAFFTDCVEIRNTRAGYQMEWTTTTTNPLVLNTPIKAAGTTVTTKNTWFTQTGNNEITYDSNLTKDLWVSINVTIDGGANDDLELIVRRYDDSLSAYEDVKTKLKNVSNIVGGLDVVDYNFIARVDDISLNDRIEIWITNTSDGTDASVLLGSEIIAEII